MHHSNNKNWAMLVIFIVVLFYLVTAHGVHLLAYLPFSFLLGCLFMHMFMHAGHGGHHTHNDHNESHR